MHAWYRYGTPGDGGPHAIHVACYDELRRAFAAAPDDAEEVLDWSGLPADVLPTSTLDDDAVCQHCGGTVREHYDKLALAAIERHAALGRRSGAGEVALGRVLGDALRAAAGQLTPGLDTADDRLISLGESARVMQAVLEREPLSRTAAPKVSPAQIAALVRLTQLDGAVDDVLSVDACQALHLTCSILTEVATHVR